MRACVLSSLIFGALMTLLPPQAQAALVWAVDPTNSTGQGELININPETGAVNKGFNLPAGTFTPNDTNIGLAGWRDELFYINGDSDRARVTVIDPETGNTNRTFNISGGWFVTGLGYWSGNQGDYLYTCGCEVQDMHRYLAADGSDPTFFWSTVFDSKAVAGDNGGRIFTTARASEGDPDFDIYEIDPLNNIPPINSFAAPSQDIRAMAFDGKFLYAADTSNNLFVMNPNTGAVLNTIQTPFTIWALASTEGAPIPEPGSFVLATIGLAGLGCVSRWRRAISPQC